MIEINPAHTLSPTVQKFLDTTCQGHYINGEIVASKGSATIAITNPATEQVINQVAIADKQQVAQAVESARAAFEHESWKRMSPMKRQNLLLAIADMMEAEVDNIAEILTLENGKLLAHAKSEIKGAANTFRYYAGWATKLEGETLDLSLRQAPGKQNFAFTRREPIGVVAAIVPWNFPISIAVWKLAPLLAAGCTVVLKPSEVTPLSTLYLATLFDNCLLYTSPSPRDATLSRMPSSA